METYPVVVHAALREMSEEDRLTFQADYRSRRKGLVPMLVATFCLIHFFFVSLRRRPPVQNELTG